MGLMSQLRLRLLLFVLTLTCIGCGQLGASPEQIEARATWEAEQYPWAFYPISEESKAALCQALELPSDDAICQEGIEVRHQDVFDKINEIFPVNETFYEEVEAQLGDFPHAIEESRQPDGTLVGQRYVYRLTEYEGACIFFYINIDDNKTVERIGATGLGSGPSPTTCGPSE